MDYEMAQCGSSIFVSNSNLQNLMGRVHPLPVRELTEEVADFFEHWTPFFSPEGDLVDLVFKGGKYGHGAEKELERIAPYMVPGCYIQMSLQNDLGQVWRWAFANGQLWEVMAEFAEVA